MNKKLTIVSIILALTLCACGPDSNSSAPQQPPPPQSADIAGVWEISCTQPAPDCSDITATVDQAGALLNAQVPGFNGEIQGGASVDNAGQGQQILEINILDAYTFQGNLSPDGRSAQGQLTIADINNGEETVPATAVLTQP